MQQMLLSALRELDANRSAVLVSIVSSQGSTPRSTGAVMLVGECGLLAGTIGGGILEGRAIELAMPLLGVQRGYVKRFELNNEQAGSLGMICGGSAEVLFTPLNTADPLRWALDLVRERADGWLCLPLDGTQPLIVQSDCFPECSAVVEHGGRRMLAVRLVEAERVFLLGGGHVSMELAQLLTQLNYRHLVVDDRAEFSVPERFPKAEHIFTVPFSELDTVLCGALTPAPQDAVCIMTRGHLGDSEAVRFALSTKAGYIGMMGSRSKRERVFAQLESDGFSDARRRVVSPIGLAIGAQTPAEIAVSIAAQLIQWNQRERSGK